jgi:hypothetical protein
MKKLLFVGLLAALLTAVPASAQSDFDGTWRIDLTKSVMQTKAEVYLLQNGIYQCKSCVPIVKIKADGQDQTVAANPHYDALSVKVLDDRSIEETEKKAGKVLAISKMIVSSDGGSAHLNLPTIAPPTAIPLRARAAWFVWAKQSSLPERMSFRVHGESRKWKAYRTTHLRSHSKLKATL